MVSCCDNRDPALLDKCRPDPPSKIIKPKALPRGEPDARARTASRLWRESIYDCDHGLFEHDESAGLSDSLMEQVSANATIPSILD